MSEKTEEIPEYGDIFALDDFILECKKGMFIDYDGFGYYSDGEKMFTDLIVRSSNIIKGEINYKFSHVVWFNK